MVAREKAIVEGMGLIYINVPVPREGNYDIELCSKVSQALQDLLSTASPVLVHCRTGELSLSSTRRCLYCERRLRAPQLLMSLLCAASRRPGQTDSDQIGRTWPFQRVALQALRRRSCLCRYNGDRHPRFRQQHGRSRRRYKSEHAPGFWLHCPNGVSAPSTISPAALFSS